MMETFFVVLFFAKLYLDIESLFIPGQDRKREKYGPEDGLSDVLGRYLRVAQRFFRQIDPADVKTWLHLGKEDVIWPNRP